MLKTLVLTLFGVALANAGFAETIPESPRPGSFAVAQVTEDLEQDFYEKAMEAALEAVALGKTARTQAEWIAAADAWAQAMRFLRALDTDHPKYEIAQTKIVEYTKNFRYVLSRSKSLSSPRPAPSARPTLQQNCDPAYPGVCIPSGPDLDCGDISHRNFQVLSPDPHRFDRDKDGIGCET